ncbi:MAG: hypothetical protein PVG66_05320 [Chromatiales bacterium]
MTEDKKQTVVKIAGVDVPVHLVWKKIEAINTANDLLERLNHDFPHLASEFTRGIPPVVRDRIKKSIGDLQPPQQVDEDIVGFLKDKIGEYSPEETVDLLMQEKGIEITLSDLVYYIGRENYIEVMRREAELFKTNMILPEQTASVWNEMQRPAPGKARWTKGDVEMLLD